MKLFKAVKSLYLSHIGGSLAAIILLVPLWSVLSRSGAAYSVITALIQIALIYSVGWRCGDRDGRKIPGFYPNPRFAAALAGWGAVIPLFLLVLRFAFPDLLLSDVSLINGEREFLSTGIYFQGTPDLIYKLWFFPYLCFMGNGNLGLYLIPILVQTGVVIAGYYVGTRRFRVLDYVMQRLIFQEKKED